VAENAEWACDGRSRFNKRVQERAAPPVGTDCAASVRACSGPPGPVEGESVTVFDSTGAGVPGR
jgi:hypothetical protein